MLSFVAENERDNIRKRQAEGIRAAKLRGVRFGRPEKPLPPDFPDMVSLWEKKQLPLEDILQRCGISESTFYRRVRDAGLRSGLS